MSNNIPEQNYDGAFYAEIGDFERENYLTQPFTHGTAQEVDFLTDLLALPSGARLLDVGCGAGRHSPEFARRGFEVVGVDILRGLLEVGRQDGEREGLKVEFRVQDARFMDFAQEFDAAICLCEGAFGVAGNEEGHRRILAGTARALKSGGPFVLTAINALSVAINQVERPQNFDPYTLTSRWPQTVTSPQGEAREVTVYCTAFTYRELKLLLERAGFAVEAAYGCVAGDFRLKQLKVTDTEIMMVARRR